jgi:predicted negative regulator of RcsB-dependent stress response
MKKILGIFVLGLLWCSISNANHALNQTKETGSLGYWLVAGFLLLFVGFFIWIFWNKK